MIGKNCENVLPWTQCTKTCGTGFTRRHIVVLRRPAFGGKECPDEEAFIYQSMSNDGTSFGGCLRFVPGSLQEPTGEPFDVKVEHVALDAAPEYIY